MLLSLTLEDFFESAREKFIQPNSFNSSFPSDGSMMLNISDEVNA